MSIFPDIDQQTLDTWRKENYARAVKEYTQDRDCFAKAWEYLNVHALWQDRTWEGVSYFKQSLDIEVVKVNPLTNTVDDQPELNTKVEVWLESGPVLYIDDTEELDRNDVVNGMVISTHDYHLDCGADTFEAAVVRLARLVQEHYGDDRANVSLNSGGEVCEICDKF